MQGVTRTLVLIMYYRYYKEHVYKWARYISNIVLSTYIVENISLVTLTFWTSDSNYGMYWDLYKLIHSLVFTENSDNIYC